MTNRDWNRYQEYLEQRQEEENFWAEEYQRQQNQALRNLPKEEQEAAFLKLHLPNASGRTLANNIKLRKMNANNLTRFTQYLSEREHKPLQEMDDEVQEEFRKVLFDPTNTTLQNLRNRPVQGVGTGTRTRNVPVPNTAFPLRRNLGGINLTNTRRRTNLRNRAFSVYENANLRPRVGLPANTPISRAERERLQAGFITHEGGPAESTGWGGKRRRKTQRRRSTRRSRR